MASPEVLDQFRAAFGVVLMLFLKAGGMPSVGYRPPEARAAATLLIIMIAAGRFSPQRMLLAGMALSTAFYHAANDARASGDPRMAGSVDLDRRIYL